MKGLAALKDAHQTLPSHLQSEELQDVIEHYRFRVPHYYLNLMESPEDPIGLQALPQTQELETDDLPEDPYSEDDPQYSPVPHLTHRYPDRALLLVTDQCPMYCRFCMRKRKTQKGAQITKTHVFQAIEHVAQTPQIREVILSGGDPLMLHDRFLDEILSKLHTIPHVEVIRIHTKMPCVQPLRITTELAQMIAQYPPVYMIVHFNHPRELTPEASHALELLASQGIPLANQTVLLKDVNDQTEVLKELFLGLLKRRVMPYYLHQGDLVKGTNHFRTRIETGLQIMSELQGQISGLAIPKYVVDGPGGGVKVPLDPSQAEAYQADQIKLTNCDGKTVVYPQVLKE